MTKSKITKETAPMDQDINIMGTPYSVYFDIPDNSEFDGETRLYQKQIHVRPKDKMFLDFEAATPSENEERYKHVMRHEILHAFLFECGLTEYSQDETLVEFLASTAPKLFAIYKEHNLLD